MHTLKNTKGISLPMVIGLVSLLMVASIAANEMIIRTLHSVHRIEAADRAYFAAEAGIEDALYELTPHYSGYETPDFGDTSPNSRKSDFGGTLPWTNEWTIQSHDSATPNVINGKIYENQKLILSLFNDNSGSVNLGNDVINDAPSNINKLNISAGNITFKIPEYIITNNTEAFTSGVLAIDNDGDLLDNGYNEDGEVGFSGPLGSYVSSIVCNLIPGHDDDCDNRENEDSPEDAVIYWKILDDEGNSLTPTPGCIDDGGSEICEKDFVDPDYLVVLPLTTTGIDQDGDSVSFSNFIQNTCGDKCQMEFSVVAPLEQVNTLSGLSKIDIPYLEYELDITTSAYPVPLPYFTLKSDGYYKDFKQSITTTVYPKTAVPLFDFTIIQQQ